LRKVSTT